MRIEQPAIDDIKASRDLVAYIRQYTKLDKTGKVYAGRCPFHNDTKRSLFVDPLKQLWNCLGACSANGKGSGGDIISFAMKYHNWTFPQAIKQLSPQAPIAVTTDTRRKIPAILSQVIEAYHCSFLESRTAQEYISSRGLDPQLAKQYKAGYVDGSLLERVSRDSADWKLLQEVGIITDAGNELMRTCVVFPLTAFNSFPVNLYGRPANNKNKMHLYLPGPRRGLFNWQHAKNFEELILAESVIDALSFIQCGFLNVIPIYGVNGFIQEHIDFVVRNRIKKVILALDPDDAGRTASSTIAEKLAKMNVPTQCIEVPAEDPNDLLQKEGLDRFKVIVDDLLKQQLKKETVPAAATETPTQERPPQSEIKDSELFLSIEDRNYNVRSVPKKMYGKLRVPIKLTIGQANYLDSVDVLSARNRTTFAARAAAHFNVPKPFIEKDLTAILDSIEAYQRQPEEQNKAAIIEATPAEKVEALAFLKSANLLDEIASDMEALGYVGELANKKLGYLGSISRFLDEPFSIVILSQSGSGKSYMADVLEKLTAPEDCKMYSRLTPASLYYMGKEALAHKFVIIEERTGSADADYSVRTLQSKKRLTLAAPVKNPETGKIQTIEFEILGPTAFLETTTASRINYENSTRCFEMYLDESVEQTEAIHRMQRFAKTVEGRQLQLHREAICRKHHNAQRALKQLTVVIPYASEIEFPASWLRTRRDHQRFLNLIEVIAFLHQYQRETKIERGLQYIEADLRDYEIACRLAADILPETLSDLKKPIADFKEKIESYCKRQAEHQKLAAHEIAFTRRAIREETGLPNQRIKDLFHELEELEYVETEKSPRGGSYLYRLVEGKNGAALSGLLSAEQLKKKITGANGKVKVVEVDGFPSSTWKRAMVAHSGKSGGVEGQRT